MLSSIPTSGICRVTTFKSAECEHRRREGKVYWGARMCFLFFKKKGKTTRFRKNWTQVLGAYNVCEGSEQNRSDEHFPFLCIPGRLPLSTSVGFTSSTPRRQNFYFICRPSLKVRTFTALRILWFQYLVSINVHSLSRTIVSCSRFTQHGTSSNFFPACRGPSFHIFPCIILQEVTERRDISSPR